MPGIFHRFSTALPDDPTSDISSNEWNDALVIRARPGETDASHLGDVVVRAPVGLDGWQLVPSAAGLLACSGVGALPAFRALTAADLALVDVAARTVRVGTPVAAALPTGMTDGDLVVARSATTGVVYFGGYAAASKYLYWDGTEFNLTGTIRPSTGVGCDLGNAIYRWTDAYLYNSIRIGDNPATTGAIRLANGGMINARKADNTNDYRLLRFNPSNQVEIGDGATDIFYNGYDVKSKAGYISIGLIPASIGALRLANNSYSYSRNNANTADLLIAGYFTDDVLYMGPSPQQLKLTSTFFGSVGDNVVNLGAPGNRWGHAYFAGTITAGALAMASITTTGFVAIGTNPATGGALRLANNAGIVWRNAANSGDVYAVIVDPSDQLFLLGTAIKFGIQGAGYFYQMSSNVFFPLTDAFSSLGSSAKRWVDLNLSGVLAIGTNPAQSGAIRLANNTGINFRNAANTADISVVAFVGNIAYIGADAATVQVPSLSIGATPANAGALRMTCTQYINSRNGANTADIVLIGLHSDNVIYMGSSGCVGVCPYNPATALGLGSAPWPSLAVAGGAAVGSITINNTIALTAAAGVLTVSGDVNANGTNGYRAPAIGGFYWQGRTFIACDAVGHLILENVAGSIGVGLEFTVDGTLRIRDKAFAGDGNLICGTIALGSAAPTIGDIRLPKNGNGITFTDAAGTGYQFALYTDSTNNLLLGDHGTGGGSAVNNLILRSTSRVWIDHSPLAVGALPASTGAIRLSNGTGMFARNAANSNDARLIDLTAGNIIRLGDPSFSTVVYGQLVMDSVAPLNINTSYITGGENPGGLGAPAAGGFQIYARNTGGKTELIAVFNTGGAIRLAIQP